MSRPLEPEQSTTGMDPARRAGGARPEVAPPVADRPTEVVRSVEPPARTGDGGHLVGADGEQQGTIRPPAETGMGPAAVGPPVRDRRTVQARRRERFGGVKIGSAFFGWLAATGLAAILIAVLAAAGTGLGWVDEAAVVGTVQQPETDQARTLSLIGAIVLLAVLFVAYFAGGYVAGRMARFSGAKQGLAVWLWGVVVTAGVALIVATVGPPSEVVPGLDIPAFVNATMGVAAGVGILIAAVVALVAAVLGGLAGMRFHRKVDRAEENVVAVSPAEDRSRPS